LFSSGRTQLGSAFIRHLNPGNYCEYGRISSNIVRSYANVCEVFLGFRDSDFSKCAAISGYVKASHNKNLARALLPNLVLSRAFTYRAYRSHRRAWQVATTMKLARLNGILGSPVGRLGLAVSLKAHAFAFSPPLIFPREWGSLVSEITQQEKGIKNYGT